MQNTIKISEFNSGQKIAQGGYRSFSPILINRQWIIDDPELEALISTAHLKLGELNAFSELIPDVNFFIKMHIAKDIEQVLEVSSPNAHSIIKDFASSKILKEKTVRGRTHIFTFADYIELFEKK